MLPPICLEIGVMALIGSSCASIPTNAFEGRFMKFFLAVGEGLAPPAKRIINNRLVGEGLAPPEKTLNNKNTGAPRRSPTVVIDVLFRLIPIVIKWNG